MSQEKPYDTALKDLVESHPADWVAFVGTPTTAPVHVIDADLATVTAAADKVIRVEEREPWILHLELQSSPTTDLAGRVQWYNTLLRYRHHAPLRSVIVLLRPSANSPRLTGVYQNQFPGEAPYLEFRYHLVKLWQVPPDDLIAAGLGTVPLAPLGQVDEGGLLEVFQKMKLRLNPLPKEQRDMLVAIAAVLGGLSRAAQELFQGIQGVFPMDYASILKDSSVYQHFVAKGLAQGIAEGKAQEAVAILFRLGQKKFGAPDDATRVALQAIKDLERLERMTEQILEVGSWAGLLATP
jgi:hypothetical protein